MACAFYFNLQPENLLVEMLKSKQASPNKCPANPAGVPPSPSRCRTFQARTAVPGVQCFSKVLQISSGLHRAALFPVPSIKL